MQKLKHKLDQIKRSTRPGFMMHIVAGYPDMVSSSLIAKRILDSGADLLEIQIPFSDPIADGAIIAASNEVSLAQGATVKTSLDMIEGVIASTKKPILIMTYFNIIHHFGVKAFCKKVRDIGVQGLIIPDYPFDEERDNHLIQYCKEFDLAFIQVIASTTKQTRIREISHSSSGFVYCMARTGITGTKTIISPHTITYLESVRENCDLPIAVGFGLSDRAQVSTLKSFADIMIVGSALIKEYADKPLEAGLEAVGQFVRDLTTPGV